jgi:hypothetical protein
MADALMFSVFGFVFAGPFVLAIAGGVVLSLVYKIPVLKCVVFLLVPAFVLSGLYLSNVKSSADFGFTLFGANPELKDLKWYLLLSTVAVVSLIYALTVPAIHFLFKKRKSWSTTLKAAVICTMVFVLMFALCFFRVTETTILKAEYVSDYSQILSDQSARLFFIQDGQVKSGTLFFKDFKRVAPAIEGTKLSLIEGEKNSAELWLTEKGALLEKIEHFNNLKPFGLTDLKPYFYEISYLQAPSFRAEPLFRLATPFIRWINGNENQFPNGSMVFELGEQIMFYNAEVNQMAVVAKGTSPILILTK